MNMGIIILVAVAGLWALGIFLGAIGGLSKAFSPSPTALDSSSVKSQEQQIIDDTNTKQKQMMDDMRQKMQDEQRKY